MNKFWWEVTDFVVVGVVIFIALATVIKVWAS